MINRVAVRIIKRNIPVIQCINRMGNLKLTHCFSDNNKKNPFDKFKRSNNSQKNQTKLEKKQDKPISQKLKIQSPQQNKSQTPKIKNQSVSNAKNDKPLTGFNKFKRSTDNQEKSKVNPKIQITKQKQKIQQKQAVTQKLFKASAQKKEKQDNILKEKERKLSQQNAKIKGFQKFKKVEDKIQGKQDSKIQLEKQKIKDQPILNSKTSQEIQRENVYKNTQKKIEEDNQEWQNFLKEQIKKQKKEKQQKQQSGQKNFNFSQKNKQEPQKSQQKSGQQNRKSFSFESPKTPFQAMRYLFFGGIAIYLGTILISQLFYFDKSKTIQTDEMLNLLQQGQIVQTWFLTTVQSLSEQSSRTKKYACATLANRQICRCESNNDFQIQWNKIVDQFNNDSLMFGAHPPIVKKIPIVKKDSHVFNSIRSFLSFALLFMFIKSIISSTRMRKGQMGKGGGLSGLFQNTKSHRFRQNINVKFNDVVGMNKAKQEIVEFIDFLKNSQKYNKLGAKIPRGALLTGPPGTGKTMLAKACAGQSGVPFFTISGSQFMQMYVGVGAQRVRNLFTQAKQNSPSIIFIDQIDAVGKKRASGVGGGGNDERDNTLNQLLVEMDGFDQTTNVIIFAATNQKQVLDPALTRPGRFDRLIEVDLPDIEGRKQIFLVHLKPITLDQKFSMDQYSKRLATLTPGFSGADIKNLCNQAAIIAARNNKHHVSMIDFQLASERIIGGVEKKSTLITPQTKKTVAYHECGHGVVSWFMEHASPLLKLTIIPRSKGSLGYAQYLPNENQVYTRKQLQDQICVILGGRMAEQVFFKKITTGAHDDLQKAHKVAKAIVTEYGMGKTLGWLSYGQTEYAKQYSHITQQRIDEEILQIIFQCSVKTRQIINDKKDKIQSLAELLLSQETIDQRMIQNVLGQRPFKSSKQYEDYIREKQKMDEEGQDKSTQIAIAENASTFKSLSLTTEFRNFAKQTKFSIVENS